MRGHIQASGIKDQGELSERVFHALDSRLERRRYPRLKKDLYIVFKKIDSRKTYKEGITKNISVAGFRVDVDGLSDTVSVGETVEAIIRVSEDEDGIVRARGRVVWMKKKNGREAVEMGVMLIYIDKEAEEKFMKCLRQGEKL